MLSMKLSFSVKNDCKVPPFISFNNLTQVFLLSCLDGCSGLYFSTVGSQTNRMQFLQNADPQFSADTSNHGRVRQICRSQV